MKKLSIIMLIALCSCGGVKMEDVKQEFLPKILNNTQMIEQIKSEQSSKLTSLNDDIRALEQAVSNLRGRIQALQRKVNLEINKQNEHLANYSAMELELIQAKIDYLSVNLINVKKQEEMLTKKKAIADHSDVPPLKPGDVVDDKKTNGSGDDKKDPNKKDKE